MAAPMIGFHASHEQFRPDRLLRLVQQAEAAGFDAAMCSDHWAPWSEAQGESGFAWSWLGAALQATSFSLGVVNAPGTIDAGYRGGIKVILVNTDPTTPISLRRGDRIAQLVVQPVVRARFVPVEQLPDSERGTGGHGSTGGFATPPATADEEQG